MDSDPLKRIRAVTEIIVTAAVVSDKEHIVHCSARLSPQFGNVSQAYLDALRYAVGGALDKDDRFQAGIPDRKIVREESAIMPRFIEADVAKRCRELTAEEMEDLGNLLRHFATSPDPTHEDEPWPMKTGRRLAYIHHVACVNRDDWQRPALYIPTPLGVNKYLRAKEDRSQFLRGPSRLHIFEEEWSREFENILKVHRARFEPTQPSI